MSDSPRTRPSLLLRIRDPGDVEAWNQFVEIYGPLVYRFARKRGLQYADASDLTQDVLKSVARASPRLQYDPGRGTFRAWLFTVTRNEILDFLARQKRRPAAIGDTDVRDIAERESRRDVETDFWEEEYERSLLEWAMETVRSEVQESTWKAFRRTAIEGKGAAETAQELGMSTGSVYVARCRVVAKLRKKIAEGRTAEFWPEV